MHSKITIIVIGIGVLVAGYFWLRSEPPAESPDLQGSPDTAPPGSVTTPPNRPDTAKTIQPHKTEKNAQAIPPEIARSPKLTKIFQLQQGADHPIALYGKVVDQYGQAVPGVKVIYSVSFYGGILRPDFTPSYKTFSTTTDSNGGFVIEDKKGFMVSTKSMTKSGYAFEENGRSFFRSYKRNATDLLWRDTSKENPRHYRAWKKGGPAALIHGKDLLGFKRDGQYHQFDLPATGGDLKIAFTLADGTSRRTPGDWQITLKSLTGGLIESTDPFMYAAPAQGYQPQWTAHYQKDTPQWRQSDKKKFYFNVGQTYGRFEAEFIPYYDYNKQGLSVVSLTYWINPNGSTNLLYDKQLAIRP